MSSSILPARAFCELVIVLCWSLSGAIAGAQQFSPAASKPSPAPTPIPLSEIAVQVESTVGSVQSIETTLSTDQIAETVEKYLPPLMKEVGLRELLHSMEIVVQTYRDQLSSWNHDLTECVKILDRSSADCKNGLRFLVEKMMCTKTRASD